MKYPNQDLKNSSQEIYYFCLNSHQICKNWLKAHEGQPLNNEDNQSYQRLVNLLKEMAILVEEIIIKIQIKKLQKINIFKKVRIIIAKKIGIESEEIILKSNLINDFGVDSLEILEIIIALEEAFNIKISERASETFLTVQHITNYISHKLNYS